MPCCRMAAHWATIPRLSSTTAFFVSTMPLRCCRPWTPRPASSSGRNRYGTTRVRRPWAWKAIRCAANRAAIPGAVSPTALGERPKRSPGCVQAGDRATARPYHPGNRLIVPLSQSCLEFTAQVVDKTEGAGAGAASGRATLRCLDRMETSANSRPTMCERCAKSGNTNSARHF